MARELTFKIKGSEYAAVPTKIERKKLYGWTEVLALDDHGNECKLVSTDQSGTVIIPKGGIGLGILSPEGKWVERSELQAVTVDGSPAELLPSSYNIIIDLEQTATPETFLDYSITAFYQLDNIPDEMIEMIGDDIYTFTYNYREAYEGNQAFLMVSEDAEKVKKLFMLIGVLNEFQMLSLEETGIIEEEEEETETADDDIDFSMF